MAINVYYAKLNNMGDLLNEYIIPEVTGEKVIECPNAIKFDVMGIGSYGAAIWANREKTLSAISKDLIKKTYGKFVTKPCAVWGTGFFEDYSNCSLQLVRKNVSFIAVRGALSQRIIEQSLGRDINPVLCDGGILSSKLIKDSIIKKYRVGFIPHYKEHDFCKENGLWRYFSENAERTIINLREEPLDVIKRISECEFIVSSSLHGCIVADSFGIPNVRVSISNIPGTGFKFDDYYSGFGINNPPIYIKNITDIPKVTQIKDNYKITKSMVDKKKTAMEECLRKYVAEYIINNRER